MRHEWYQTNTEVVVSILARNVPKEKVSVDFSESEVDVTIQLDGGSEYLQTLTLFAKVVPSECKYSVGTAKIELKLRKHTPGKWESLEGSGDADVSVTQMKTVDESLQTASKKVYSGSKKDWDAIDADLKKKEEEEKP